MGSRPMKRKNNLLRMIIGVIASLRHFAPLNTLHQIYISLIQPYLLNGIVAWGHAAKTYINKILILQKRALRLMFFGDYNSHAVPYFSSLRSTMDIIERLSLPIIHGSTGLTNFN